MPINDFQRVPNYFNNKVKIKANEIDNQFNDIVDFINSSVLPVIYDLTYSQFTGVTNPVYQNSFLLNKGDGTTLWGFITIDCFQYNGISLSKIQTPPVNSILTSGIRGNYSYLSPTANNQVVRSVLNNSPIFGQIVGNCFEPRSILGRHIALGSLTPLNIVGGVINVQDNSLPAIKFTRNCVTNLNLETVDRIINPLGGIQFNTLVANVQAVFPTMITSNMIPDSYFNNYFNTIFGGANTYTPITAANYGRIFNLVNTGFGVNKFPQATSNLVNGFTLSNLKQNSINGNRLHYFNTTTNVWTPNDNNIIANGEIQPQHLTPELRVLLDL